MSHATEIVRSGFVAVAGRPNAGKSTLVNAVVGQHVAIVSPIAQTTRRAVRACIDVGDAQVVLVDLPGSQNPLDRMTSRMQHAVDQHLGDVDVIVWVIDGRVVPKHGEQAVADSVFASGLPVIIALNKIDQQKPNAVIERITQVAEIVGDRTYHALVPVSARTGDGVGELIEQIVEMLPEGPPMFPPGMVTDMRPDELIAEYIREASLAILRDELPHATGVEVLEMEESASGAIVIESVIWVERESQVGIVVGKGGAHLKEIGTNSRKRIERLLNAPVHLDIRVKVRKRWRDDERHLERMGL